MTLSAYLSRVVATRIAAVLAALTGLVLLIEMLEAIRRMLGGTRGMGTLLTYLMLRTPLAVDRLLPLAMLIGAALAFSTLARSNEMAILRAAGLSPFRFLRALLPVVAVFGAFNFLLEDRWAPAAERAFATWWQGIVQQSDEEAGKSQALWLRVDGHIVSVGRITEDGRHLDTVNRYERDADGRLTQISRAASAAFDGKTWQLTGNITTRSDGRKAPPETVWADGPDVENMRQLTLDTDRVSGAQARRVLTGEWVGKDGTGHYRIVIQRSYAAVVTPLVMVLLAVPALHGGRRAGNLAYGLGTSLTLGLFYLVVNGLFLSMGEANAIPPAAAVWAAPLSFTLLGIAAWLHFEE